MLTIEHDKIIYPPEQLILMKPAAVLGYSRLEFTLRFFCRSRFHPSAPFKLGWGIFTRNRQLQPTEAIYGVHQDRCDVKFPIEIK